MKPRYRVVQCRIQICSLPVLLLSAMLDTDARVECPRRDHDPMPESKDAYRFKRESYLAAASSG